MDFEFSHAKHFVGCILAWSLVIGFFSQVFASDRSLTREIALVNNVNNVSRMISNLNDADANLQLQCAVRVCNETNLHRSRNIEQGQSHTWKIDHSDKKNNQSRTILCSRRTNVNKFYSLSLRIDEKLKSAELKQDWLVTGDGLQKSDASTLSARWNANVEDEQNNTLNDVDPVVRTVNIIIKINNIMYSSNVKFTRVDILCVAKSNNRTHFLGTTSIVGWHWHIWRIAQRNNVPDTVSCTFNWIDDFHQRYVMQADIFDSKPRTSNRGGSLKAVRRVYFVTKSGLAYGRQEVYVAQWTKAVQSPDPVGKMFLM